MVVYNSLINKGQANLIVRFPFLPAQILSTGYCIFEVSDKTLSLLFYYNEIITVYPYHFFKCLKQEFNNQLCLA